MALDFRTLIALNITVQIILALALAGSIYLAKRRSLKKHCKAMRIIVPVQILAILGIMLPAMSSYTNLPAGSAISGYEILIHHALGLGVVVLWVYINLVFLRYVKPFLRLKPTMQMAAAFWMLSLILGVHIYSQLYATNPVVSILPAPQENATVGNISQQNDPGTYDYYCMIHPYMKAKVIVTPSEGQQHAMAEVSQVEADPQPMSLAEPGSEISIVPISTTSPQPSTRVTVDLLAKNMNFDKDKITVIAGSKVFINFVNLDVGVPHNFAVYTGPGATRTIFQGRVGSVLRRSPMPSMRRLI